MNIKENIKSIIKNTYNIIYKVFIEKKDERKLQKFIDEKCRENNETIYYVISCEKLPFQGLFGYVGIILAMVKYALEKNMVPVVDLKNNPNTYLKLERLTRGNFSFNSLRRRVLMKYMKNASMSLEIIWILTGIICRICVV